MAGFTKEQIDAIMGRSEPNNVERISDSNPTLRALKELKTPFGNPGRIVGGLADMGQAFFLSAPRMWDELTIGEANREAEQARRYGVDPTPAYDAMARANMRMQAAKRLSGTEKVPELFTLDGRPLWDKAVVAAPEIPNTIAQEILPSLFGHPVGMAGKLIGGGIGLAIGAPIVGGGIGGTLLGADEYKGDIIAEGLQNGLFPGAEKAGYDGIDPIKLNAAAYGSAALDSFGDLSAVFTHVPTKNPILKLMAKLGAGAIEEGPAESGQQFLQRYGADESLFDKEAANDILQAGGMGALMGAGLGAAGTPFDSDHLKGHGGEPPEAGTPKMAGPSGPVSPSGAPEGYNPGSVIDADKLRLEMEKPKAQEPDIKTEDVSVDEAPDMEGIKSDVDRATRYASAAVDKPDIEDAKTLPDLEPGSTRSVEVAPVFERTRLGEDDALEIASKEIQLRKQQGMTLDEALEDFHNSPISEELAGMTNPTWHSSPIEEGENPSGYALKIIDTRPDGTIYHKQIAPDGKLFKTPEEAQQFIDKQKEHTTGMPKQAITEPARLEATETAKISPESVAQNSSEATKATPPNTEEGGKNIPLLKAKGFKSEDSVVSDLEKFHKSPQRNAWIDTNGYNVYVRKNLDGNFDLANINRNDGGSHKIEGKKTGDQRGSFKELLSGMEKFARKNGYKGLTVENVQNKFLPGVLEKYGYTSNGNTGPEGPTFHKSFQNEAPRENRSLLSQFSPAEKEVLAEAVRKQLDGMKFQNIGVAIIDSLGGNVAEFDRVQDFVLLAMDAIKADKPAMTLKQARQVINHEIVHAFLSMGIIDPATWESIKQEIKTRPITKQQAKKLGWTTTKPGMTWLQAVVAEYPHYSGPEYRKMAHYASIETPGLSFEQALEDIQIEEAVAEFSRLQGINNDAVPAFARRLVSGLVDAVRRVFNAVRNFLRQLPEERRSELEDFVKALHRGDLGPGEDLGAAENYIIPGEEKYDAGEYDGEPNRAMARPRKGEIPPVQQLADMVKAGSSVDDIISSTGRSRGNIQHLLSVARAKGYLNADEGLSPTETKTVNGVKGNIGAQARLNAKDLILDALSGDKNIDLAVSYDRATRNAAAASLSKARTDVRMLRDGGLTDDAIAPLYGLTPDVLQEFMLLERPSAEKDTELRDNLIRLASRQSDGSLLPLADVAARMRSMGYNHTPNAVASMLHKLRSEGYDIPFRRAPNRAMARGDGAEYFGPKKSDIDPNGFFSALERSWEAVKNRPNLPERLTVAKWIQRLQAARVPNRPKMEEIKWFFRDTPLDATLSKASIDKIIAENRLILNKTVSEFSPGKTPGKEEDSIRPVRVRLPGEVETKFEDVLSLPEGVPGSQFEDSHQFRDPINVRGAYVSVLGEVRPVQTRTGESIDAVFSHQIQSDLVQTSQDPNVVGYGNPLNTTGQFVRIGIHMAAHRAASNGMDAVATPFGETADRIQGGIADGHSRVRGRNRHYTRTVRNELIKYANKIGATIELGYVPYDKPNTFQKATPELMQLVSELGFAEAKPLQDSARRIASLLNSGRFKENDLSMLLANMSAQAAMLGDAATSNKAQEIARRTSSLVEPVDPQKSKAPVYIMRLDPKSRANILNNGMPLFMAAKKPRHNPRKMGKPRHNPRKMGRMRSEGIQSDYLPTIPGVLDDLDNIRSQIPFKNEAPKMLKKPIFGGVFDHLDKMGSFGLHNLWKKAGPLGGLYRFWGPLADMKDQDTYNAMRMLSQGRSAISPKVTKVARILSNAEPEHEAVMDYLQTRSGTWTFQRQLPDGSWTDEVDNSEKLALERIKDPATRAAAVEAKQMMIDLGHLLVKSNIISEKQRQAHEGTYLPRMFVKFVDQYRVPTGPRMSGVGYNIHRKGGIYRDRSQEMADDSHELIRPEDIGPYEPRVEHDITPGVSHEEDVLAGKINDPGVLLAHAVHVGIHDAAVQNFLAGIMEHSARTNSQWVLPRTLIKYDGKITNLWQMSKEKERIDKLIVENVARNNRLGRKGPNYDLYVLQKEAAFIEWFLNNSKEWKEVYQQNQIPNGYRMVPQQRWRYGPAAGAIVKKEIYHDLVGASSFGLSSPDEGTAAHNVAEAGRRLVNVFKMSKTVLNPKTQFRQHISNMLALPVYGVNMARYAEAIKKFTEHYTGRPNPEMEALISAGLHTQGFTQAELRRLGDLQRRLLDTKSEDSRLRKIPVVGDAYHMGATIAKWAKEGAVKTSNAAGDIYQLADTWAKLAVIIDEMDRGSPPIPAALKAQKLFGDYSAIRPWVRLMRNFPVLGPFITYNYIMMPNMIEVAATAPWRFAPFTAYTAWQAAMGSLQAAGYAVPTAALIAAYAALSGDDEEKKKQAEKIIAMAKKGASEAINFFDDDYQEKRRQKLEAIAADKDKSPEIREKARKELKDMPTPSMWSQYKMTQPDYVKEDPFLQPAGGYDKYGRLQTTSMTPMLPFAQFAQSYIALRDGKYLDVAHAMGIDGGPIWSNASVWGVGIEPGLGRTVWDKYDPDEVKTAKSFSYSLGSMTMPWMSYFAPDGAHTPLLSFLPGYSMVEGGRGYNAFMGNGVNKYGDPNLTPEQAIQNQLAFNIYPGDKVLGHHIRMREFDRRLKENQANINQIRKDKSLKGEDGKLSDAGEQRLKLYQKQRRQINAERKAYRDSVREILATETEQKFGLPEE